MSENLSGTLFQDQKKFIEDQSLDIYVDAFLEISNHGNIKVSELEKRPYKYEEIDKIIAFRKVDRGILMMVFKLGLYPVLISEISAKTKSLGFSVYNYSNDYIHFSVVSADGIPARFVSYNRNMDEFTEENDYRGITSWIKTADIPRDYKFYRARNKEEERKEFEGDKVFLIREFHRVVNEDFHGYFDLEKYALENSPFDNIVKGDFTDIRAFRIVENKYVGLFEGFDSFQKIYKRDKEKKKEVEREKEAQAKAKEERLITSDQNRNNVKDVRDSVKDVRTKEVQYTSSSLVSNHESHILPKVSEKEKIRIKKFEEFENNRFNFQLKLGAVFVGIVIIFGLFILPIINSFSAYGEFNKVIKDDVINVCKVVSEGEFEEFYKNNFDIDSLYKPVLESYGDAERENALNEFKEKVRNSYKESVYELNSCYEKIKGLGLQPFITGEISVNISPKSSINIYPKYNVTIKFENKSLRFTFERRENNFKAINFITIKN